LIKRFVITTFVFCPRHVISDIISPSCLGFYACFNVASVY
jgi:hypothetical protein